MAETPPVAPVRVVTDVYFGTKIDDPYRYLEDFEQPEVQAWVKAQAEYAARQLAAIPGRDRLLARLTELDAGAPYTLFGVTPLPSGDLFYFKQLASENVAKIYRRDGRSGEETLLIDPETFPKASPEEHFTISFFRVSPQGTKLLYGSASSGSEETTLRIFDVAQAQDLPDAFDRIEAEYMLPSWLPDGESFVFSRRRKVASDAPPTEAYKFTQCFWHRLGQDPAAAKLVFASGAAGSPTMREMDFPAVYLPAGSDWAIGQVKHGDAQDLTLYAAPRSALGTPGVVWTKICDEADQVAEFAVHGDEIYLMTAHRAPRYAVVKTALADPDFATASPVLPAGEHVVDDLAVASDALYIGVHAGVRNALIRVPFAADAAPEPVDTETSIAVIAARADMPGVWVASSSWIEAARIGRYDPPTRRLEDMGLLPRGQFDTPAGLVAREVLVESHDGVKTPLSIICQAEIKLDGSHPTLLSGYGAYGARSRMHYSPTNLAWLQRGGVLAIAHVRGGGAFGKEWHLAGQKLTKPNTWKDFIACAEYLVREGYTSPAKLAGQGGSGGGILIGRAITSRPDLFAAANIAVGCTEMLRFETTMNGPPNVMEFGTIAREDEFRGLLEMSTFHHIRDGVKYPAVILTHGIHDPRVEPWLSAKTTARLQAATASGKPVLFRVEYHAGHGIGSTKKQRLAERADLYSFFLWQMGEAGFQPPK